MKKNSHSFTDGAVRTVAVAVLLATLTFASAQAVAAKASAGDRVEARITELRTLINITPAQEAQWGKVMEVMRDNAKALDALTKVRSEHAKTMRLSKM
jgi:DNA-binding SARP family transcriptional activator